MAKKFSGDYMTVASVFADSNLRKFLVTFKNGDEAHVKFSSVLPKGMKYWHFTAMPGEHGNSIYIPGNGFAIEIPWNVIRTLTDPDFAKVMVDAAAKQALEIGARLRHLRNECGLTQRHVAGLAGIEPANLSRIENGRLRLNTSTLWKILAAMGYSPADLASQTEYIK